MKAFCPMCGELEVIDGVVQHPEQDRIMFKILENSFSYDESFLKTIES